MGIPRLLTTLEPYATFKELQGSSVVIDGPAFAYHILHVCRVNGISQPSYELLGETAVSWLNAFTDSKVTV